MHTASAKATTSTGNWKNRRSETNIERFECERNSCVLLTHLFVVHKYFRFDIMIRKIKNAVPNWIEWTVLRRFVCLCVCVRLSSAKSNAIFKSWRFSLWLIPFPKWMLDLAISKRAVRLAIHVRPHQHWCFHLQEEKYALKSTFKRKVSAERTHTYFVCFFLFLLFSLYLLMLIMLLHRLCEVEGTQRWT